MAKLTRLKGTTGDDVFVYNASQNISYDGGAGSDTLRLVLTREQWMGGTLQSELASFLAYLNGPRDQAFSFQAFNLEVRNVEKLEVMVDGVLLDPRDEAVDAVDDAATVAEGASAAGNVLANDLAPDLVRSTALVSGPAHGGLTFHLDGSFVYVPGAYFDYLAVGESENETFVYQFTDADGDSDTATVILTVSGVNDAPLIGQATPTGERTGTIAFSDVDSSDTHTVSYVPAQAGYRGTFAAVLADDSTGDGAGSVAWTLTLEDGALNGVPAGQSVTQLYSVTVADRNGGAATQTVAITLTGTGAPSGPVSTTPVAKGDSVSTTENQPVTLDVLANDSPGGFGGTLTLISVSAPLGQGTASIVGNQLYYDPGLVFEDLDSGETGTVVISYTMQNSRGAKASSKATITIQGENDNDPVTITSGPQDASVVEDDVLSAAGTLTFTDPDSGDTHVATFVPSAENTTTLGTFALGALIEPDAPASGLVN